MHNYKSGTVPAVSQIWSLMRLPSSSMVRILKSIPMVVMKDGVKESSEKRSNRQDLPTPMRESPREVEETGETRTTCCTSDFFFSFGHCPAEQVLLLLLPPFFLLSFLKKMGDDGMTLLKVVLVSTETNDARELMTRASCQNSEKDDPPFCWYFCLLCYCCLAFACKTLRPTGKVPFVCAG